MSNNIDLIVFVLISTLTLIDIIKHKNKIKLEKIVVLRFFESFIRNVEENVKKNKLFFNIFSIISLVIALPTIVLISFILISSFLKLRPTVALVLPTIGEYRYPGPIISVPFFYWIISIFLIIFFHETMHAVIALNENIKVKRYGLIYLFLIPIGAFVDLDEKKLKDSKLSSRIKIYAAGSLGNFILAFLVFVLYFLTGLILEYLIESRGVYFDKTVPNSPASEVNLSGIILQINETKIRNIQDLSNFLKNRSEGEPIKIYTSKGEYILKLAKKDNRTYIGIEGVRNYLVYKKTNEPVGETSIKIIRHFFILTQWILFLSIGVGLANMLPIVPLDGGLIIRDILIKTLGKKKGEKTAKILSTIFVLIIVLSFLLYLKSRLKVF